MIDEKVILGQLGCAMEGMRLWVSQYWAAIRPGAKVGMYCGLGSDTIMWEQAKGRSGDKRLGGRQEKKTGVRPGSRG